MLCRGDLFFAEAASLQSHFPFASLSLPENSGKWRVWPDGTMNQKLPKR
jgi:hypothetical protein